MLFCIISFRSRGVAILLKNKFYTNKQNVYRGAGGNFMFISLTVTLKNLMLLNGCGPNRDSPEFYNKL